MRKIKLWHLFSHLFFYMIGGLRGSDTTLKSVKSRREMDELGMDELGLDELDMDELGLYELGMDKLGLDEFDMDELSLDELGMDELDMDELGMDELDMDEFVMDELGMGKQLGMTHAPAFQYYYIELKISQWALPYFLVLLIEI